MSAARGLPLRFGSLALLLLGLSLGCKSIPFPEPVLDGPYGAALTNSTRRGVLYDGLETRAFLRVVRVGPALASEQARLLSQARSESPAETEARHQRALATSDGVVFFAVVFTSRAEWNDWQSKQSAWNLVLDRGGEPVHPSKVERFERPFHPDLQLAYPYLDEFHVAYRISFPVPQGSGPYHLVAAGSLGKLEFDWRE